MTEQETTYSPEYLQMIFFVAKGNLYKEVAHKFDLDGQSIKNIFYNLRKVKGFRNNLPFIIDLYDRDLVQSSDIIREDINWEGLDLLSTEEKNILTRVIKKSNEGRSLMKNIGMTEKAWRPIVENISTKLYGRSDVPFIQSALAFYIGKKSDLEVQQKLLQDEKEEVVREQEIPKNLYPQSKKQKTDAVNEIFREIDNSAVFMDLIPLEERKNSERFDNPILLGSGNVVLTELLEILLSHAPEDKKSLMSVVVPTCIRELSMGHEDKLYVDVGFIGGKSLLRVHLLDRWKSFELQKRLLQKYVKDNDLVINSKDQRRFTL